jgi:hypothetical protein
MAMTESEHRLRERNRTRLGILKPSIQGLTGALNNTQYVIGGQQLNFALSYAIDDFINRWNNGLTD